MQITILGSGANGGIPQLGCGCRVCMVATRNPSERRFRSSLLITLRHGKHILVDATPDIRLQLAGERVLLRDILLVLLTHSHFDHSGGLMEFLMGKPLGVEVHTHQSIADWLMDRNRLGGRNVFEGYINFRTQTSDLNLDGITVSAFQVPHTNQIFGPTLGYDFATGHSRIVYIPDLARYERSLIDRLSDADTAILDGTFYDRSLYNHVSIKESISILGKHGPKRMIFTHVNHTEGLSRELSARILKMSRRKGDFRLAKDGLKLELK